MAFSGDQLVDRRRLARSLTLWRIIAILAVLAAVVIGIGRFAGLPSGAHIARLTVEGLIVDDDRRIEAIRRAAADPAVEALIVRIDSPGGTVVGGERLYATLREAASAKPVVAVLGSVAASAGYMVALAADRVVARRGTVTGSIGVIFQTAEITRLLEMIGVEPAIIRSAPLKAAPNPLEKITPRVRAATQALVDDTNRMFVEMVAERRGLAGADLDAVTDGRVFTGQLALGRKLVDALGGEREAITWLETERGVPADLPVRDLDVGGGLETLFASLRGLARKTVLSERLTLDGLVAVWQPALR